MERQLKTYSRECVTKHRTPTNKLLRLSKKVILMSSDDESEDEVDEIIASPMRKRAVLKKQTQKDQAKPKVVPRIEIDSQSLKCLEPGKKLNDTIVEFYMNYLLNNSNPIKRLRFHLFNTFFYNKLSSLYKDTELNGNSESSLGQMIKRWDKKVKIFDKDFIVIPICDNKHWVLVIICYAHKMPPSDEPIVIGDGCKLSSDQYKPFLIIFDSLGYKHMTKFTEPIRAFLTYRWRFEKPNTKARNFKDRNLFKDLNAQVPIQRNHYDCGVHMLISFEKFLADTYNMCQRIRMGESLISYIPSDTFQKRLYIKSLIPGGDMVDK